MSDKVRNTDAIVYGGQAIIEGVMFKSPSALSLGVRLPTGKVHTEARPFVSWTRRLGLHRIPFLRGITIFIEMLYIGVSYLNRSATLAMEDGSQTGKKTGRATNNGNVTKDAASNSLGTNLLLIGSFVFSTILALLAFKFLPLWIASVIWNRATTATFEFTITEGVLKLAIFLLYLIAIRRMKDVHRVFEYHGAEHKVIRTFEAGQKLTVSNVRSAPRYHPRCGTSFIVFVILLSIVLYSLVPLALPLWQLFVLRIVLLPVLAGISYELLALTAKINEKSFWAFLLAPGYFVQSLTTAEPDDLQISVALASFEACRHATQARTRK